MVFMSASSRPGDYTPRAIIFRRDDRRLTRIGGAVGCQGTSGPTGGFCNPISILSGGVDTRPERCTAAPSTRSHVLGYCGPYARPITCTVIGMTPVLRA